MTREEQKLFIHGLLKAVEDTAFEKIDRGFVPAGWQSVELRWWLQDWFEALTFPATNFKSRRHKYLNDRKINPNI